MRCALLACKVPVELVTPNWSNKLVEDSAGRMRPASHERRGKYCRLAMSTGVQARRRDMEDAPALTQSLARVRGVLNGEGASETTAPKCTKARVARGGADAQ